MPRPHGEHRAIVSFRGLQVAASARELSQIEMGAPMIGLECKHLGECLGRGVGLALLLQRGAQSKARAHEFRRGAQRSAKDFRRTQRIARFE